MCVDGGQCKQKFFLVCSCFCVCIISISTFVRPPRSLDKESPCNTEMVARSTMVPHHLDEACGNARLSDPCHHHYQAPPRAPPLSCSSCCQRRSIPLNCKCEASAAPTKATKVDSWITFPDVTALVSLFLSVSN